MDSSPLTIFVSNVFVDSSPFMIFVSNVLHVKNLQPVIAKLTQLEFYYRIVMICNGSEIFARQIASQFFAHLSQN